MCSYNYEYPTAGRQQNKCEISTYFSSWDLILKQSTRSEIKDFESVDHNLPLDKEGHSLFHSRDVEWKVENKFHLRFFQLWHILQVLHRDNITFKSNTSFEDIDLRECYFIGTPIGENTQRFITITDIAIKANIYIIFQHSLFEDIIRFNACQFNDIQLDFKHCDFKQTCQLHQSSFGGIAFDEANFQNGLLISNCTFNAIFESCDIKVEGIFDIITNKFHRDAYFNESSLQADFIQFDNNLFAGKLDLSNSFLEGDFNFSNNELFQEVKFINTIFQEPVSFFDNTIENIVLFKSTTLENKVFLDLAHIAIDPERLNGTILFEQVNFMNILEEDRQLLIDYSRENKVVIGKGCIKYRLQSADKVLYLDQNKQSLIIEFAHSFAHYFVKASGINLGVEIKERDKYKVIFFYFSDENIPLETFHDILGEREDDFLSLLYLEPNNIAVSPTNKNRVVNIIDSYASLLSTFIKVSIRIATGNWEKKDTASLHAAINFRKTPMLDVNYLHKVILDRFNSPQIINHFRIEKNTMKINKPTFHGGNQQFGDYIFNNNYNDLSQALQHLLGLLPQNVIPKEDLKTIIQQAQHLERPNLDTTDKNDLIVSIKNIVDNTISRETQNQVNEELYKLAHLETNGLLPQYHAFLSFAEEDAPTAEALYQALRHHKLDIWFSRIHLKTGDSIMGVIASAIQKSKAGIILLSKNTFNESKHFPILELNTFLSADLYQNKLFLPVYHGVTPEFVATQQPLIGDRLGTFTTQGITKAAKDIHAALQKNQIV